MYMLACVLFFNQRLHQRLHQFSPRSKTEKTKLSRLRATTSCSNQRADPASKSREANIVWQSENMTFLEGNDVADHGQDDRGPQIVF